MSSDAFMRKILKILEFSKFSFENFFKIFKVRSRHTAESCPTRSGFYQNFDKILTKLLKFWSKGPRSGDFGTKVAFCGKIIASRPF